MNSARVWYASEVTNRSIWKFVAMDDTGDLEWSDDSFVFSGKKNSLKSHHIQSISFVRQMINWPIHLLAWTFGLIIFLIMQIGSPLLCVWFGFVAALGLYIGYSTRWVEVAYDDGQKAYFASARHLGWSGLLGGTKSLYRELTDSLHHRASAR